MFLDCKAGRLGVEPRSSVLETDMLPLHYQPKKQKKMRAGFEPTITGLLQFLSGCLTSWLPHHVKLFKINKWAG